MLAESVKSGRFRVRLEARLKNDALISAREKAGIKTAKEVAGQLGISKEYYWNIESMRSYPSRQLQEKICAFYREREVFLLEEDVFPEELKYITPERKYVARKEIPTSQLISLSQVPQRLLPLVEREAENYVERVEFNEELEKVLGTLKEKERQVIRLIYGFVDGVERTQTEVAQMMGVSKGWISCLEHRALKKLRHPRSGKVLRKYVNAGIF